MDATVPPRGPIGDQLKQVMRRLLALGGNRLELLLLEVQEERARLLHAILLALAVATLALLAGGALTGAIVVLLWDVSRVATLLVLTSLYGGAAIGFYLRLTRLLRDWQNLPATCDQLRKDCACLDSLLT